MTKQEFETRANTKVIHADYEIIEYVYTFHPAIDEVKGKDQIAELYNLGGMRLMKDMVPTAKKMEQYEGQRRALQLELQDLEHEMKNLRIGA